MMGYLEKWAQKVRAMRFEADFRHQDAWDEFMIEPDDTGVLYSSLNTAAETVIEGRPFRPTRAAMVSREPASVRAPQPAGI